MKKLLTMLAGITVLLSLSSCGKTEDSQISVSEAETSVIEETIETTTEPEIAATEAVTETSAAEAAAVYPVTITDQAGREVVIEEKPEKLVSGYYISTSAMISLGLKDKLVGIEAKADKRPIYKLSAPELIDLPNVGTAKEFDLEGCIALEPDVVVLPIKLKDVVADLEAFDIDVILVNPETSDQLEEMIDIIAAATDTKENADKLTNYSDAIEEQLGAISGDAPSVYLAGNASFLTTAGAAMYQSDMIKLAGGKNAAEEITDTYWAEVSYEDVLAWNPEYIIIASDAEYEVEEVLNDSNLAEVSAVVNQNVYKLPGNAEAWDSPVPSGILGSVWAASILHSDEMSEQECNAIINEFYSEFYGFNYSEAK
ncbi:MAG: ABC transporter substrate-binding protein [Oscillospiraceae bacterium]|nr:ABC transporter substrate-binding protein [Oscillospiraceae bacterium]